MRKEVGPARGVTPAVRLREVIDNDLATFFEFQRDPIASRMAAFTSRDPNDRSAFEAHWKKIRNDPTVMIRTIVDEGRVVGHVASFFDKEFGKPEVTYWIGRDHWGKGLATAALRLFLDTVKVRPLYGRTAADNVGSLRVMEKCGFKIVGESAGFANGRGEEVGEYILELGSSPIG